jgi:hypothetical protein
MKGTERRFLVAAALLGGLATSVSAAPWWQRIILPNPRIDATSSYTQHKVPSSFDLWPVSQLTDAWFAIAYGYADFNGDGQLDTATVPVGLDYESREPRIVSLGSPLEDITSQARLGEPFVLGFDDAESICTPEWTVVETQSAAQVLGEEDEVLAEYRFSLLRPASTQLTG